MVRVVRPLLTGQSLQAQSIGGGGGYGWSIISSASSGLLALQLAVDLQTGSGAYHCTSDAICDVISRVR